MPDFIKALRQMQVEKQAKCLHCWHRVNERSLRCCWCGLQSAEHGQHMPPRVTL